MNFDFSEPERKFHRALGQALAELAPPEKLGAGENAAVPEWVARFQRLLADAGYLKLGFRESERNTGGSLQLLAAQEILAAFSQSLYLTVEMSARMFGGIVRCWGDPAQQAQWLPGLHSGKMLGAVALSEDAMNVTNEPLKTVATEHDNAVLVSGKKTYVVNAPWADWIAVVGRIQDRTAVFVVDNPATGLAVDPKLATMGYEAAAFAGIELQECRIPAARVIWPPDEQTALATLRLWENQILIAASLGMTKTALASAREFAKAHHTGGKPIVAYQAVAFKLAEMLTLYQTSQLLAYRAAWTADSRSQEREGLMLCAKVFCAESAEKVAGDALQILSGQGYQRGSPAGSAYACAKYAQIAGTSMEIARVMIGDEALGYR